MEKENTSGSSDASPNRRREMEMDPSSISKTSTDATTFLDLNDNCLYKMYEHLDLPSLCSVADACSRLRRTAQDHFGRSEFKNFDTAAYLKLFYPCYLLIPVQQVTLKVSNVLRIFGAFIIGFEMNTFNEESEWDQRFHFKIQKWDEKLRSKYRRKIVELLSKYCSNANLIELKFSGGNLKDEDGIKLRPLLKGLKALRLFFCQCSAQLVQMLPTWCPELRQLEIRGIKSRLNGLRQPFQKLTTASIMGVHLDYADVELFLKCNPQLKEFSLHHCTGPDDRIFQYIGKYATEIETLNMSLGSKGTERTRYPPNARYFDRLRNLKNIYFDDFVGKYIVQAICDIVSAEIPLKTLGVSGIAILDSNKVTLENNVKKLKTLETLCWGIGSSNFNGIIDICKHLTELSKLELVIGGDMTAENLLELVRAAEKLQWLYVTGGSSNLVIDIDIFKSIIEVIEARADKTHLKIQLGREKCRLDIPEEFAATYKGSLTIVLIDPPLSEAIIGMLSFDIQTSKFFADGD